MNEVRIKNIGIVITHYNTIEKTIDCMKSFWDCNSNGFHIEYVIVDNGSKDGSGRQLVEYFSEKENVKVLSLPNNIPFARAMDEGVTYLNGVFDMDYMIMSNNDIIIKDETLFADICASYERNSFAVMGPNVYSVSTRSYSNPIQKKANFSLMYNILSLLRSYCDIILRKWNKNINLGGGELSNTENNVERNDVMLHGCFLVFSRRYMDRFPGGLYPQDSFYMEENILFYLCRTNGLKTVYEPKIKINHIHSVSIKKMFDDDMIKKNKFTIIEHKKSKITLIKIIIMTQIGVRIKF